MEPSQIVAAGGFIALFSASAVVLFKSMTYEGTIVDRFQGQIDDLSTEMDKVKEDNQKCHKANHILITTLQQNGMKIPEEAWL